MPKAQVPRMTMTTVNRFIDAAREQYGIEGSIEVDDPANPSVAKRMISSGEDWKTTGVYVKAWVWVETESIMENPFDHESSPIGCPDDCKACEWERK